MGRGTAGAADQLQESLSSSQTPPSCAHNRTSTTGFDYATFCGGMAVIGGLWGASYSLFVTIRWYRKRRRFSGDSSELIQCDINVKRKGGTPSPSAGIDNPLFAHQTTPLCCPPNPPTILPTTATNIAIPPHPITSSSPAAAVNSYINTNSAAADVETGDLLNL